MDYFCFSFVMMKCLGGALSVASSSFCLPHVNEIAVVFFQSIQWLLRATVYLKQNSRLKVAMGNAMET